MLKLRVLSLRYLITDGKKGDGEDLEGKLERMKGLRWLYLETVFL